MPKYNKCVYSGCENYKEKNPDVTFHRLPKDAEIQLEWIVRTGNPGLADLTDKQLANKRVCSDHFHQADFLHYGTQGNRKLNPTALPIDVAFINNDDADFDIPVNDPVIADPPMRPDVTDRPPTIESEKVTASGSNDVSLSSAGIDSPIETVVSSLASPLEGPIQKKIPLDGKNVPRERKLLRKLLRQDRQLRICRQKINRFGKSSRTKKLSKNDLIAGASLYLSDEQLLLFKMQINHTKKSKWSEEEKQFALSLYYKSPKAYVFLRDVKKMALPCVTLIRKWINDLNLTTGFNADVFKKLYDKAQTMSSDEKQCVLMWDEMSIKRMMEYNSKEDLVEGFHDLGELGRSNKIANYALLFMLRGLKFQWKQPVAYFVSHGNVSGNDLAVLIQKGIEAISNTGLTVRSMVCDQGTPNRKAITALGITESKPYFEFGHSRIYFLFDFPHLIKSVRNNLIAHDFLIDDDIVSWGAIRELREVERNKAARAAPKLTDRHIDPNNFQRMTVSLATQVFSASVSAAMMTGHTSGDLSHSACVATANFAKKMNDLFDCMNSRYPNDSNPYKCALSAKSPQVEQLLRDSVSWLEKWSRSDGRSSPACFSGIRLSVNSTIMLWQDLKQEGALYQLTSRLNQDILENTFAVLRSRSGYNASPSATQFRRNLQYAMTVNLMKPPKGTNCEDDNATLMLCDTDERNGQSDVTTHESHDTDETDETLEGWDDWDISAETEKEITDGRLDDPNEIETDESPDCSHPQNNDIEQLHITTDETESIASKEPIVPTTYSLEECSMKYVAGYLAHKCITKFSCEECAKSLTKPNQNLEKSNELLIFWRAYKTGDNNELGNLKAPVEEFHALVVGGFRLFNAEFIDKLHEGKIREKLYYLMRNSFTEQCVSFWTVEVNSPCVQHRKYITELLSRLLIFYKLKWMSRDMRDSSCKRKQVASMIKPNRKLLKVTHQ